MTMLLIINLNVAMEFYSCFCWSPSFLPDVHSKIPERPLESVSREWFLRYWISLAGGGGGGGGGTHLFVLFGDVPLDVVGFSLPAVINYRFLLQLHWNITSYSMENLAFHTFPNERLIILPILIKLFKIGRMYLLSLGMKQGIQFEHLCREQGMHSLEFELVFLSGVACRPKPSSFTLVRLSTVKRNKPSPE